MRSLVKILASKVMQKRKINVGKFIRAFFSIYNNPIKIKNLVMVLGAPVFISNQEYEFVNFAPPSIKVNFLRRKAVKHRGANISAGLIV